MYYSLDRGNGDRNSRRTMPSKLLPPTHQVSSYSPCVCVCVCSTLFVCVLSFFVRVQINLFKRPTLTCTLSRALVNAPRVDKEEEEQNAFCSSLGSKKSVWVKLLKGKALPYLDRLNKESLEELSKKILNDGFV